VRLFEEVKDRFDPTGLMNPGKIVRPTRMNDRTLFRYKPDYRVPEMQTVLDWGAYPGAGGGFQGAVEMCNNNGECRKHVANVMCPSFRVTGNERDVTRGRANSLRLAISGQLGPDAFASDDMLETMKLCVSCKGCRRECPTGVDMAKMKIEVLAARNRTHKLSLHDRLVAYLPRYAPYAARLAPLMNLRDWLPGAPALTEGFTGFSARRKLPEWRGKLFDPAGPFGSRDGREVALFADTFNTYFEPEILWDAVEVLARLGYRVLLPRRSERGRPLCCGRTFLSAGLVEEARSEAQALLAALAPLARRGVPIVGLEPSCLLTLRDEFLVLNLGSDAEAIAERAVMLEEFIAAEAAAGHLETPVGSLEGKVLLHGHCHQKSFGIMAAIEKTFALIDGVAVQTVESSCCGMAGAFGYGMDTYETSMAMGELSLLPAVRKAGQETLIAADGFSCRHQIRDGTGRAARHVATILCEALAGQAADPVTSDASIRATAD
jgi:Fe-S oxidoreductase